MAPWQNCDRLSQFFVIVEFAGKCFFLNDLYNIFVICYIFIIFAVDQLFMTYANDNQSSDGIQAGDRFAEQAEEKGEGQGPEPQQLCGECAYERFSAGTGTSESHFPIG